MDKQVKRIGFLLTAYGVFVFCKNTYYNTLHGIKDPYDILVVICTCSFFLSSFFNNGKYVQILALALGSLPAIYDNPNDGFANSNLVIVAILMYKYGMFRKKPITKLSIYVSIILLTSITGSIMMKQDEFILYWTIKGIVNFLYFFAVIIIIFFDEIKIYIQNEKKLKSEIDNLSNTVEQTKGYIEKIEAKYVDPEKAGLTGKELGLLEALCLYRESNTELGKRLGKSPNTVKVQLSKIMNKVDVETRHDLINHCRYYFIKNSEKETVKV